MKNLKIGQRLALSFGSVVVVLIILATIAFSRIDRLDQAITLTNEDRYPKTVHAHIIADELNETARNMRNTLLMTNPDEIKGELANIAESSRVITQSLNELEKTIKSEEGLRYMAALTDARGKFSPLKDRFVTLMSDGMKEEALALLFTELRPAQLAYMTGLEKLVDYQGQLMKQSGDEAHSMANQAKELVAALS